MNSYRTSITFGEAKHLLHVWYMYNKYVEDEPFNSSNELSGKSRKYWDDAFWRNLRLFILCVEQEVYRGDQIQAGTAPSYVQLALPQEDERS